MVPLVLLGLKVKLVQWEPLEPPEYKGRSALLVQLACKALLVRLVLPVKLVLLA